jgi:5'-methylthioinosine phosphorylase
MVRDYLKTIAIIAGSGLAQGLESLLEEVEHHENVKNQFGVVLSYYAGFYQDMKVIILPRHGDSTKLPSRSPAELVSKKGYESNIWQLHQLNVDEVYGFTAVGALDKTIPLASKGTFMIPDNYVRGLAASQHSFGSKAKNVHTPMSNPFAPELRNNLFSIINDAGYSTINEGLYIYNGGDTFETEAEIRLLDRMTSGEINRVVGMTTVPEAILLNQVDIPFVAICSNVNYAEGLSHETLVSHEQTLKVMDVAADYILKIVKEIIISK